MTILPASAYLKALIFMWVGTIAELDNHLEVKRLGNREEKKARVTCDIIVSHVTGSSSLPKYKKDFLRFSGS